MRAPALALLAALGCGDDAGPAPRPAGARLLDGYSAWCERGLACRAWAPAGAAFDRAVGQDLEVCVDRRVAALDPAAVDAAVARGELAYEPAAYGDCAAELAPADRDCATFWSPPDVAPPAACAAALTGDLAGVPVDLACALDPLAARCAP